MARLSRLLFPLVLVGAALNHLKAQNADSPLLQKEWIVDGVSRQALIHLPSPTPTKEVPVLFVFHGHGGTMKFVSRGNYHGLWPDAIVVYPQGLPTSGHLVDKDGKMPGWQFASGEYGDRDLKFFDAMLATAIKDYHANPKWIFVTGHSNGGRFSQLLWAARGDKLTATAASATSALNLIQQLKAKPYLQISGEKDPLVSFRLQEMSLEAIKKVNGCTEPGIPEKTFADGQLTRYPSKSNAPTLALIHQGGHTLTEEGPGVIIHFFQEFCTP